MTKKRVVITGLGIVSSLGNSLEDVTLSLQNGKSGITAALEYKEKGFRSCVYGKPAIDCDALVDRRLRRFMSDGTAYGYIAMKQAVEDAGLSATEIEHNKTGVIVGAGGTSTQCIVNAADTARSHGSPKRIGPFTVPQAMASGPSANLSTAFKTKGVSYSLSSACATSAHCIGHAYQLIQAGIQDVVFAGGVEELDWALSALFDAMGAMSTKYNDTPTKASRAFDKNRDGFVIAGGGSIVVLEDYEHAIARGVKKFYGEIVGYGFSSDGFDMVQPSGEGAVRCMRMALENVGRPIDYINPHGTSTPVGDLREIQAIEEVFGNKIPPISSTKSLSGHSLGAVGGQELIFSLLMMQHKFIAASANIDELDEPFRHIPIVQQRQDNVNVGCVLSNSFGFGGTNACLVVKHIDA